MLCAFAALAVPAQALGSDRMYMGAAEDEGRNADPAVAMAKMQLAKAAGFDTIRITAIWEPGLPEHSRHHDGDELRQPHDAFDGGVAHTVCPLRC